MARATTVVNFTPNASFPMHQHVGGEDRCAWYLKVFRIMESGV